MKERTSADFLEQGVAVVVALTNGSSVARSIHIVCYRALRNADLRCYRALINVHLQTIVEFLTNPSGAALRGPAKRKCRPLDIFITRTRWEPYIAIRKTWMQMLYFVCKNKTIAADRDWRHHAPTPGYKFLTVEEGSAT